VNDLVTGATLHPALCAPDFQAIRQLGRAEAGTRIQAILEGLVGIEDRVSNTIFHIRMECFRIAEEKETWRDVIDPEVGQPFKSADTWIKVMFPQPRYCEEARATVKALHKVPYTQLLEITAANCKLLANVSSSVHTKPEVLEFAKTHSKRATIDWLNKNHGQHLEHAEPVIVPKGDNDRFEAAITMSMALGAKTRAEAVVDISESYIMDHAVEYGNWLEEQKA
jgi:hypothetical protein